MGWYGKTGPLEAGERMLIIGRNDLQRAVAMDQAMDAVATAFAQLSYGQAEVPLRLHVAVPAQEGLALVMPAYLAGSDALGVKALTLFPHNLARRGLPAIHAIVLLFDTADGRPLALLDGGYLTALRTGAAAGIATRIMARADAQVLALFGAGAQALPQAWAVCVARPIQRIWIVNRTRANAERLAAELRAFGPPIPADVRVAPSAQTALAEADVVCCATASPSPLFADADVRPGTHINGIGSYRPTMREVPAATVARARVVVDERRAAWAEAGDLVMARDEGLIDESHVVAELGELVAGHIAGRTDDWQVTFFKSVGNAVQDIAVAQLAYTQAQKLALGTEVRL
jgi:ornithine cyclodeaminase/alanine dehydrogenase-like protein (mu-crystallin family)